MLPYFSSDNIKIPKIKTDDFKYPKTMLHWPDGMICPKGFKME